MAGGTGLEVEPGVFTDNILPPITILIGCMLVWWWPTIRVALRLPGHGPKVVKDAGAGLAAIALPAEWRQTDSLGAHTALQAADRFNCRYVIVISESLEDFDETVDLWGYSRSALTRKTERLELLDISGPFERAVASFDAVQFEYKARVNGQKITYLHTTVAGRRAFHQVIGWSASSRFNRRAFDTLLDGFAEQPGPVPERPHTGASPIQPPTTSRHTVH